MNTSNESNQKILFKDQIWKWLDMKKEFIKESSYANYSNIISNHIIPKLGDYYVEDLSCKIIQEYVLELSKSGRIDNKGGLSKKAIKDTVAIIKSSLQYAVQENIISNINLDIKYPKTENKQGQTILTPKEQNKLINYIQSHKSPKSLGVLLALFSGIRIGELCALQGKDFDFKNNVFYINKTLQRVYIKDNKIQKSKIIISDPKTHNSARTIPLSKDFANELKSLQFKSDDYILTGSSKYMEPRSYRRFFYTILKKSKIRSARFHTLRHTFATNCIDLGVDYKTVSELLGHSTVNITLNLYVHPKFSQKQKCINLISKKFKANELNDK